MIEMIPNELWRSARTKDLNILKKKGIKRLIDFQTGAYEFFHEDKREYQQPADFGILYYPLPCSNFSPPERRVVKKVLSLLETPLPTLMHCALGEDRTGFVAAVVRMVKQGWSYERAHDEWVRLGRKFYYSWWKYELQGYAKERFV